MYYLYVGGQEWIIKHYVLLLAMSVLRSVVNLLTHFILNSLSKAGISISAFRFKCLCCLLGEESESQLHGHGSVHSGRLSAGQGGRTEFHAKTEGTLVDYYFFVTSINTDSD